MKALVLEGVKQLHLRDVPMPVCDKDGVLIKVMANGICRSDWHKWHGHYSKKYPIILGHEFCGIVEEAGTNVTRFKPGDRVIVPVSGSDGTCEWCKSGHANLCNSYLVPGIAYNGGFAEYVAVPLADWNVEILPNTISFSEGSALGCRFISAYHGLLDVGRLKIGDWLAVFGCGGVGLSAVNIGRQMGAFVVGIDINPGNLNIAKELGADYIVDSKIKDPVEEIMRITNGRGVNVAVDSLGSKVTCLGAFNSLGKQGRLVQIGVTQVGPDGDVPIPVNALVHGEKSISGSLGMPIHEFKHLLDIVAASRLTPGKMLTGEVSLSDVVPIFEKMETNSVTGTYVVTDFTK
jgi:propanol-preferring alcohol dehydrogenase